MPEFGGRFKPCVNNSSLIHAMAIIQDMDGYGSILDQPTVCNFTSDLDKHVPRISIKGVFH